MHFRNLFREVYIDLGKIDDYLRRYGLVLSKQGSSLRFILFYFLFFLERHLTSVTLLTMPTMVEAVGSMFATGLARSNAVLNVSRGPCIRMQITNTSHEGIFLGNVLVNLLKFYE